MPELTEGDIALLKTHPHKIKEHLAIMHPATVLACHLDGAPASDPVVSITYKDVTEGDWENVAADMTLWIGTSTGGRQKGTCRIRKAATANTLYIAEDSAIDWVDGDHLTVVENYEYWVKYPRVIADGSVAFYKDWEVAYNDDQHSKWAPVAIMGPPDCQFIDPTTGLATVKFVGEHSYAVAPGKTISKHDWTFPEGDPDTANTAGTDDEPHIVTWDTPGIYWVTLTVTDTNNKSHTGRRPVFIFERTGENAPYTHFLMSSRSGDIGQHGHTASFEIHGDADQAEFPDGAMVVYWTEDWYGDTQQSIGGNFPYRSHIKFVGYIQRESTTKDPQTSTVTFEAATIHALMDSREGFSCWIKNKGSASNWCEATNLTADRAALSLCRYHSTLLDIADVLRTGNALYIKSQEFEAKTSLLQQLQGLYDDLFAHVACDKQGRVYFEIDPQMRPVDDRDDIPIIIDLEHGDWRDNLDLPRPQENQTSFVNLAGVCYPGHPAQVVPILSKAPGDAPAYTGRTTEISGLILGGQADGNQKAGLALARDNNQFPDVTVPMAGMWDVFDIVPQEYITLTLAAGDTKRGIVWDHQKLIPRRVGFNVEETEQGRVARTSIQAEKDSYGPAGVDGDYPDEVPEALPGLTPYPPPPPPPPGPEPGDGNLLYFVDYNNGHVFRTRNAREPNPTDVIYEDLGVVGEGGLYEIILDPWDPRNTALVCGRHGAWKTTNLDSDLPAWTQVLTLADWEALTAAASICQQGLWMIGVRAVAGDPGRWIYVSTDGCATYDVKQISELGGYIRVEWSAHVAGKGWAAYISSNIPYVARTLDAWDNWTNYDLSGCLGTTGGQLTMASPHHRFLDNPVDHHGLFGGHDGAKAAAAICRCLADPPGSCTIGYPGGIGSGQETVWIESYTWGTTKYWCLTYDIIDALWHFYISDDALVWTYQHTFSQIGGWNMFISGWPYDGERFYATQNGTVAPILISDDRGETWQAQIGNWASLGYNGNISRCVPVWIE